MKILQSIQKALDALGKVVKVLVFVEVIISTINFFIKEAQGKMPELDNPIKKDV